MLPSTSVGTKIGSPRPEPTASLIWGFSFYWRIQISLILFWTSTPHKSKYHHREVLLVKNPKISSLYRDFGRRACNLVELSSSCTTQISTAAAILNWLLKRNPLVESARGTCTRTFFTSVFYASVLLLMINCVITLSKWLWNYQPHAFVFLQ